MDKLAYTISDGKTNSYRFMAYPLQQQKLQLLYPGRYLLPPDWYTSDNILNENPEELETFREESKNLAYAAKLRNEALSRHLGGTPKVIRHPAVEPEYPIEDPELRSLTLENGPNPFPETINSPIDNVLKDIVNDTRENYESVKDMEEFENDEDVNNNENSNVNGVYVTILSLSGFLLLLIAVCLCLKH